MGYTTTFHLVGVGGATRKALVAAFPEDYFNDKSREHFETWGSIWAKWYDHEKDIARAMVKCGAHTAEVIGIGEHYPDDIWEKTFQVGPGTTVTVVKRRLEFADENGAPDVTRIEVTP